MSRKYNGLQNKIIAENSLATWVPRSTHSLNFIGKSAVECCSFTLFFLNFLEEMYAFFPYFFDTILQYINRKLNIK